MTVNEIITNAKNEMAEVPQKLKRDLGSLRTGRANPQMIEQVRVDYYGVPVLVLS